MSVNAQELLVSFHFNELIYTIFRNHWQQVAQLSQRDRAAAGVGQFRPKVEDDILQTI